VLDILDIHQGSVMSRAPFEKKRPDHLAGAGFSGFTTTWEK